MGSSSFDKIKAKSATVNGKDVIAPTPQDAPTAVTKGSAANGALTSSAAAAITAASGVPTAADLTLTQALQAKYNQAQTDLAALRTSYNLAQTDISNLVTLTNQMRQDMIDAGIYTGGA